MQRSIADVIREEILSGKIAGGTEMTQTELANLLGVSRMPVREALVILEYAGLVERLPNNHVRVAALGEESLGEIFRLLAAMEGDVLERCGEALTDEVSETKKAAGLLSLEEVPEELVLHRKICDAASNAFVKSTLRIMVETYAEYAIRHAGAGRERRIRLLEEAILGAGNGARGKLNEYFSSLEEACPCMGAAAP